MEMALRTSNLILPQGFVEMDREEMMYVDGGGFVGVQMSYGQIAAIATSVTAAVGVFIDVYEIGSSLAAISPFIGAITAKISATVGAILGAIPVWGWIALGVLAVAVGTLASYCLINKCGFKIGVNIGWFSAKGVWEFR